MGISFERKLFVKGEGKARTRQNLLAFAIASICVVPAAAQELPSCNSKETIATFINAINNSPAGRVGGLQALDLKYPIEIYASKDGTIRLCDGQALLNVAEKEYYILLEREDDGKMTLTTMPERFMTENENTLRWDHAVNGCIRDLCGISVVKGRIGNKKDGVKKTPDDGKCIIFCMYGFTMKLNE